MTPSGTLPSVGVYPDRGGLPFAVFAKGGTASRALRLPRFSQGPCRRGALRFRRYRSSFARSRSLLDSSIPCILLNQSISACYPPLVFAKLHSARPARLARHCAARVFSFTSFASLTSSKSFIIRTSKTPLPQLLYNPHLQAPLGSAGNKGLITPLESALTRNSPVSLLESALTKRWGWGSARPPTH